MAGVHVYIAYFVSFVVGATCNVVLLRRYFAPGRYSFAKDLVLTLGSNGVLIALAFLLFVALMEVLAMPHVAAKLLSNGISALLNYAIRRMYF